MSQADHDKWLRRKMEVASAEFDKAVASKLNDMANYHSGRYSAVREAYEDYTGIEVEE